MVMEVESEGVSSPVAHDFDHIEGNTLEEVEEGSSDSETVALKVVKVVNRGGCGNTLCDFCFGQWAET
jgi:hypothetical protein